MSTKLDRLVALMAGRAEDVGDQEVAEMQAFLQSLTTCFDEKALCEYKIDGINIGSITDELTRGTVLDEVLLGLAEIAESKRAKTAAKLSQNKSESRAPGNESGLLAAGDSMPRLALAIPPLGTESNCSPASLAWLAGLSEQRWRVQHFQSRAYPTGSGIVGQITGLPGRHLDAWLMPDAVLHRAFANGAKAAELSLVEGTLEEATGQESYP